MSVPDLDANGRVTLATSTSGITIKVLPTEEVFSIALRIVLGTKTVELSNGLLISQIKVTIVVGGIKENAKLNLSIHCTTHNS